MFPHFAIIHWQMKKICKWRTLRKRKDTLVIRMMISLVSIVVCQWHIVQIRQSWFYCLSLLRIKSWQSHLSCRWIEFTGEWTESHYTDGDEQIVWNVVCWTHNHCNKQEDKWCNRECDEEKQRVNHLVIGKCKWIKFVIFQNMHCKRKNAYYSCFGINFSAKFTFLHIS